MASSLRPSLFCCWKSSTEYFAMTLSTMEFKLPRKHNGTNQLARNIEYLLRPSLFCCWTPRTEYLAMELLTMEFMRPRVHNGTIWHTYCGHHFFCCWQWNCQPLSSCFRESKMGRDNLVFRYHAQNCRNPTSTSGLERITTVQL
jgi:hypothetical protein